ncbi:hypothetical protein [Cylindrospermum sp. FACHB-282]|uniref:hypothetical protein n=1 Tax=Cylindrospermum sp. FACHB-282 TaxID=2692794 RepID=UPI001687CFA1|nr:hypothetical protein [Cylindrospermum sp. FACHB-282]MBD2386277.1 hypothetical protein [Cylindrospermum sp. FACHB-282]
MTLAYIITEGKTDREILQRLLPQHLLKDTKIVEGVGSYGARSLASSLMATRSTPVALVIDADTEDESQISEKSDLVKSLLHQVFHGIPFQVSLAVPEIEIILLQDKSLIEKIAKRSFTNLEWQFAQSQPKRFLAEVFGKDTPVIDTILSNISDDDIKILQQHPLIQDLINFLSSVAVAPTV